MHLRIQSGESLRSYFERNLYLNWKDPSAKVFEALSRFYMRNEAHQLKRSRIYEGICSFGFHIPKELVLNVLHHRLVHLLSSGAVEGERHRDT